MIRCHVTNGGRLIEAVRRSLASGVEWIQIREKQLPARELHRLVVEVLALPNPYASKILVNTRVDVALAAGAAGAHLPAGSPEPRLWRAVTPVAFLIGVSCHTVDEVQQAERDGADYAVFGPVFAPLSKSFDLPARGLDSLREAARAVRIPVLALGGITWENAPACCQAGAAGVAGITLFQTC